MSTDASFHRPTPPTPSVFPGFLVALGPDGPVGYATRVAIEETDAPGTTVPVASS